MYAGKDPINVGSYRPLANLPELSKLFERMVAQQIWVHLQQYEPRPVGQSGFRADHSSEAGELFCAFYRNNWQPWT
jgi:hypothetical protein